MKHCLKEHEEQVLFLAEFELAYPSVLIFAIPNGGDRNPIVGARLKAEGVKPGVPDLFIPAWHTWVEMKRVSGGRLNPAQKEMIEALKAMNYQVIVARGADDGMRQLRELQS